MVFWNFFQIKVEFVKLKTEVSGRSFIKRQPSGTSSDNKRQRVVQQVTTNDNEWYNKWHLVTTSSTTNDKEWHKWQRMTTSGTMNESHFRFQNETTMQCKTTIYSATSFRKYNVKQNIGRSSYRRCSIKKMRLTILQYSQENTWSPATLLKRDSNTSVFPWILQNF